MLSINKFCHPFKIDLHFHAYNDHLQIQIWYKERKDSNETSRDNYGNQLPPITKNELYQLRIEMNFS